MKRLLLLVLFSFALRAQTPHLVKDINTTRSEGARPSSPYGFFAYGQRIYFVAFTQTGLKLLSTDGTAAGTTQIASLRANTQASLRFAIVNGKLLFNNIDSKGEELWITDGTSAGTHLFVDLNPDRSSSPGERIVYHDKLYFSADDGIDGNELWVTDGTPAGTRFFKDLASGQAGSNPHAFVIFNGLLYFATDHGLWKSDGTENGTAQVKAAGGIISIAVAGSKLIFSAFGQGTGGEPWVSDGTADGTHMIADILPGPDGSVPYGQTMTAFGDRVLFFGSDEQNINGYHVFVTDGTAAGTHRLRDAAGNSMTVNFSYIAVIGNTAYFTAATPTTGYELWKTDGTDAGTSLVRDIMPGSDNSNPRSFAVIGNQLYFAAISPKGNAPLWVTDGTSQGTHTVKSDDGSFSAGNDIASIGGTLYFAGANLLNGLEPWKSDGTDAGTTMIANLYGDLTPGSMAAPVAAASDWLYFWAWDGLAFQTNSQSPSFSLWRTDGSPEGTLRISDAWTDSAYPPRAVGRSLYFYKEFGRLWKTDGTPETTADATQFKDRFPGLPTIQFVNGDAIFAAVGYEEWLASASSNAAAQSLHLASPAGFADFLGRTVMFIPASTSTDLWISDGTIAGTSALMTNVGTNAHGPSDGQSSVMGGRFYFAAGNKLWKTDGTPEGTVVVKTLTANPGKIVAAGRNVFFTTGTQLWVTDGSEAGTRALPATVNSVAYVGAAGDRIVFVATPNDSAQLWGSDGTAEGTRALSSVDIGATGQFISTGDAIYFKAFDTEHGSELGMSDGTPEGTKLVADIEPGTGWSSPSKFMRAGDNLYFNAETTATGSELWALPLATSPRLSINDIRVKEGDTTAHLTVMLSPAANRAVTVDYATSDDSASAGSDYEAASGTLTFAPGETSKSIDVHVHADTNSENNESFFITLRNATGAAIAKSTGFALIEDDNQQSDLVMLHDFSTLSSLNVSARAQNNGPRVATNVKLLVTQTPYPIFGSTCQGICSGPITMQPGENKVVYSEQHPAQSYITVTVSAQQRDPQPSNNSVAWTSNGDTIAMNALYLTPGARGDIYFFDYQKTPMVSVESSDPAVVAVPSSTSGDPATFIVYGGAAGTTTLRIFTPTRTIGTLTIDVVPTGTTPRWKGGIDLSALSGTPYDQPATIHVYASGTAPFTGKRATGTVFVTSGAYDLGRVTLDGSDQREWTLHAYLPEIGPNPITATYSGDANFRPMSASMSASAAQGHATLAATIDDHGSTATIHVRVIGSPMGTPTGKVLIGETSVTPNIAFAPSAPLTATATPGVAEAAVTLTNLPAGVHTFRVWYPGDSRRYAGTQQDFRIVDAHKRVVRH